MHRLRRGLRTIEHDGAGPGFLAWLLVVPERRIVLAVACNGDGESRGNAARFARIVDERIDVLLGDPGSPTGA